MYSSYGLLAFALVGCFILVSSEPTWQSLRATWGINVLSSRVFSKLPKTENKARSDGFVKLAGECSGGKFRGYRYMKGLDTAAVMIYDINGRVAGIQYGIPRSDVEKTRTTFSNANSPVYQLDKILGEEEVYFITAYIKDPKKICTADVNDGTESDDQGIGTGLYLQNGTDPVRDSVEIPMYENDTNGTKWVKGGCFRTMGVHYWYDAHEDMSCSYFVPFSPIYNRGKVTSFAFFAFGNYEFSRRFEHPSASTFKLFLPTPPPKCLVDEYDRAGGVSAMHVFLSVRPWNILC